MQLYKPPVFNQGRLFGNCRLYLKTVQMSGFFDSYYIENKEKCNSFDFFCFVINTCTDIKYKKCTKIILKKCGKQRKTSDILTFFSGCCILQVTKHNET